MKNLPSYLTPEPYHFPYNVPYKQTNDAAKVKKESREDSAFMDLWCKEHHIGEGDPYASAKTIIEEFFKK